MIMKLLLAKNDMKKKNTYYLYLYYSKCYLMYKTIFAKDLILI